MAAKAMASRYQSTCKKPIPTRENPDALCGRTVTVGAMILWDGEAKRIVGCAGCTKIGRAHV